MVGTGSGVCALGSESGSARTGVSSKRVASTAASSSALTTCSGVDHSDNASGLCLGDLSFPL